MGNVETGSGVPVIIKSSPITLDEMKREACVERCRWRQIYNEQAGKPTVFSFEECELIAEQAGAPSLSKCGLAAICVGLVAREGDLL